MSGNRTYQGFTVANRLWIIWGAVLVGSLNLSLAWWLSFKAIKDIPLNSNDIHTIKTTTENIDDSYRHLIKIHTINTIVHLKGISNKQSIIVIAIGSGFAFMALGFSLFLIGVDSAFKVKAEQDSTRIVLIGTAPGLVCFVIAGILIGIGITRTYQLDLGNVSFPAPDTESTNKIEPPINNTPDPGPL